MRRTALAPVPLALGLIACLAPVAPAADRPPNVVILFADDLGYGDLGCYGHPTIRTPHLDRMAREGQRWTNFYAAECVCTPSRAGLLTGRLPVRSGMSHNRHRVLFPDSTGGLPASEITLAEAIKAAGYATACVGKWHLGHLPRYLPTRNGFDQYFGIPYSNDMDRAADAPEGRRAIMEPEVAYFQVPLMRDDLVIERPADQRTLTRRYADEAVRFIDAHADRPFFLYLPFTMPHVPLFRSEAFAGRSARGTFGDAVEELDANVGRILETLRARGLDRDTVVFFTSDNGPWLTQDLHGGSAGLLRDGKGSTWEGGMREPMLAWSPGRIPAGETVMDLGCTMDLFVTALKLAGAEVPADRPIDGLDLRAPLTGSGPSPRDLMLFYRGTELFAVRKGPFKAHFITMPAYGRDIRPEPHDPPILYHLGHDPSEQYDVAAAHPEVISEIRQIAEAHKRTVTPVPNQLAERTGAK